MKFKYLVKEPFRGYVRGQVVELSEAEALPWRRMKYLASEEDEAFAAAVRPLLQYQKELHEFRAAEANRRERLALRQITRELADAGIVAR